MFHKGKHSRKKTKLISIAAGGVGGTFQQLIPNAGCYETEPQKQVTSS